MKREMTTENFPERQAPSTLFDPQVDTRRPGYYYSYQPSRDAQPVLPINDERPFSDVLASFLKRHHLTAYASDEVFLVTRATIGRWLNGHVTRDRDIATRALMTLIDQGIIPLRRER